MLQTTFDTLTLRNFKSYGNNVTVVDFSSPGTTMIVGEDVDSTGDGQGSNGTGKSTIIGALVYAGYDRSLDKDVPLDGLVNDINKKDMEVTLTFTAGKDGRKYKIERYRKRKSGAEGNGVRLWDDRGVDISTGSATTNKMIEGLIGMPYDAFVRTIAFTASSDSFLKLPISSASGPSQKAFIEELLGLTTLSEKASPLKEELKSTKAAIDRLDVQIATIKQQAHHRQQQVDQVKRKAAEWDEKRVAQIKQLTNTIDMVNTTDIDGQRKIHAELVECRTAQTSLKYNLVGHARDVKSTKRKIVEAEAQIEHLENNQCPHCHQEYAAAKAELAQVTVEIATLLSELTQQEEAVLSTSETLTGLQDEERSLGQKITVDNIDDLIKLSNSLSALTSKLEELHAASNPFSEVVGDLRDDTEETLCPLLAEKTTLERLYEHQNILFKLLTKNDSFVRKELLNRYLPLLNSRLRQHTQDLGLLHTITFNQDLTVTIKRNGVERKFGTLSTGQRARVDFAFSITFKEMRERLHGRTNVCLFDEVLDFGMDAVGVVACAKMIKQVARETNASVFVISHRNEIDRIFEKKMVVRMENGFSRLVTD